MSQAILKASVKIPALDVKHLMMSTLHMTQKPKSPKRNWMIQLEIWDCLKMALLQFWEKKEIQQKGQRQVFTDTENRIFEITFILIKNCLQFIARMLIDL